MNEPIINKKPIVGNQIIGQFKLDVYYDAMCSECGVHLSTDYNCGLIHTKASAINKCKENGWVVIKGKNYCERCKNG